MSRVVYSCAADAPLHDEIVRAFARFEGDGAPTAVLVFPAAARISRDIVEPIVSGLARCKHVKDLTLVHPNALLGFITSSINLQAQQSRVRAVSTMDAANA